MQRGSSYDGSPELMTSVAGEEIIPDKRSYYKFSLINKQDTTVSVNESSPIFISAGVGFTMNEVDGRVSSFKILEDGIEYHWIGGY